MSLSCETLNEPHFIQPPPVPPAHRCTGSPRSTEALDVGKGVRGGRPAGRMRRVLLVACRCPGLETSGRGNSGHTRRSQWGWRHMGAPGLWCAHASLALWKDMGKHEQHAVLFFNYIWRHNSLEMQGNERKDLSGGVHCTLKSRLWL